MWDELRTDEPKKFVYERPETDHKKDVEFMAGTDHLTGAIQVVREGGANNLHSHTGQDGFWYVLSGRARYYTENEEVLAELEPGEGIIIPHNTKYWFESADGDPVEILQVEAKVCGVEDRRIDHQPREMNPQEE